MKHRRIATLLLALFVTGLGTHALAQTTTEERALFTENSPTALVLKYSMQELMDMGYKSEAELSAPVIVPRMQIYNPKTGLAQWVTLTKEGKFLKLPAGTTVLIMERADGSLDYSDFIVYRLPGNVPGCGNRAAGVNIQQKIKVTQARKIEVQEYAESRKEPEKPRPELKPQPEAPKCEGLFLLDAHADRKGSVKKGLAMNALKGLAAAGLTATTGAGGLAIAFAGGLTFVGGMGADWKNPRVFKIEMKLDEDDWELLPVRPSTRHIGPFTVRTSFEDAPLGGKVAWLKVDGHPECDPAPIPIPNNTNFVFVVGFGDGDDNGRPRWATNNGQRLPTMQQSQSNTSNNANDNNNGNNINIRIVNRGGNTNGTNTNTSTNTNGASSVAGSSSQSDANARGGNGRAVVTTPSRPEPPKRGGNKDHDKGDNGGDKGHGKGDGKDDKKDKGGRNW